MDYRSIGTCSGDGSETEIAEPIFASVFLVQQKAEVELTYRLTGSYFVFQDLDGEPPG